MSRSQEIYKWVCIFDFESLLEYMSWEDTWRRSPSWREKVEICFVVLFFSCNTRRTEPTALIFFISLSLFLSCFPVTVYKMSLFNFDSQSLFCSTKDCVTNASSSLKTNTFQESQFQASSSQDEQVIHEDFRGRLLCPSRDLDHDSWGWEQEDLQEEVHQEVR